MRVGLVLLLLTATFAGCVGEQDRSDASEEVNATVADEPGARTAEAERSANESIDPEVSPLWAERVVPFGPGHDHAAVQDHRKLSTPNMQILGYNGLETRYHNATSGDYFCGGKAELGDRTIAVTHSFETDVALVVVDVSDPAQPEKLGELALPNTHVWDVSVTDDGSYAILGVTPNEVPPENDSAPAKATHSHEHEAHHTPRDARDRSPLASPRPEEAGAGSARDTPAHTGGHSHGPGTSMLPVDWSNPFLTPAAQRIDPSNIDPSTIQPVWRNACGEAFQGPETQIPYVAGGVLVDLSDLTRPRVSDYVPQPLYGGHSVVANTIDGTHYVLVATANTYHPASYFSFYTIEDVDTTGTLGARLAPYGTFSSAYPVPEDPREVPEFNGHVDGWIQQHPETGATLAYLANNNGGLVVVELAGRGQLEFVGTWNDYDPEAGYGMTGSIHTARPLDGTRDGRHLTIAGQELGTRADNRPTGEIILMDTTDPTAPTPVARWTLPVDVEWDGGLMFSTHYVALDGDTLYIALWHGGVWVTDIGEEHWPELPSLGAFLPGRESPSPPPPHLGSFVDYSPVVLDVFSLGNGTFATFDGPSGVYTVSFDPSVEVPVPEPWTADAWIGTDG